MVLGDPLTPEDPVALGPLRGFAKVQAPRAPRMGVAQTFLVFILLLAWAQAGADRDFLVVLVGHQESTGGHGGKSSGESRQDSALPSPKQVLDGFRVKKLCRLLPAASPWTSRDARPHAWGTVRASSSHGSDNPASRPRAAARFTGMRQVQGQAGEPAGSMAVVGLKQLQQLREELEAPG